MCDADGTLFDGDQLLYAMVKDRQENGLLRGGVVGTLMTNLALEQRFAEMKIPFQRANVGDRYVLEMLREKNWQCGGENSGHLLCLDKHSTGDGIISALQVLSALRRKGIKRLGEFTAGLTLFPQVLINVRIVVKQGSGFFISNVPIHFFINRGFFPFDAQSPFRPCRIS